MTGLELLKKLSPLIPPPKLHIIRFHGVFAPNAKQRSAVVPKPTPPTPVCLDETASKAREQPQSSPIGSTGHRRSSGCSARRTSCAPVAADAR